MENAIAQSKAKGVTSKKASAFTIMNGNEAAVRIAIKNNYPEKATEFLELANEGMKLRRDRIQVLKAL